ncbi:MAG: PilZ domain-containing protein [Planctomycetes bacterium]|nr:PilZ domain-containing protein [Planctomycetota bacterium]MBL7106434.1 PilZ domain-containing protein [Phycisphaerae bacterium]
MKNVVEKRREQRLRYQWPIWFAEDLNGNLFQGQMVDISSGGAAFKYYKHECNIHPEQEILIKFSVPQFDEDDSFEIVSFKRIGKVRRVEDISNDSLKAAVEFAQPLTFKPAEDSITEQNSNLYFSAV